MVARGRLLLCVSSPVGQAKMIGVPSTASSFAIVHVPNLVLLTTETHLHCRPNQHVEVNTCDVIVNIILVNGIRSTAPRQHYNGRKRVLSISALTNWVSIYLGR